MNTTKHKSIVDFIRKLYKTETGPIYLHEPQFNGNEKKYLLDAIDSTFVSSVGKYVDLFEKEIAKKTGAKYAVAVMNGTAALHVALKLVGVKENTEVLTQSLTFIATANAISYERAIPHFIDIDRDTLGMSPMALKLRLDQVVEMKNNLPYNKETGNIITACVPMHTFGLPLRIDRIIELCDKYNIPVVEDAAESLGSYFKGAHTGTNGLLGTFSFNGNKTITSGGGGAIVTNDEALAKLAKHITTTAKIPHRWEYKHDQVAYNYRMPNLNAALACAQLEQLDTYVESKRKTSEEYERFFDTLDDISLLKEIPEGKANYWLNAIVLENEEQKTAFLDYTNSNGVMTRPVWKLMNQMEMFKDCPKGDLSIATEMEQRIVNIPSSVRL